MGFPLEFGGPVRRPGRPVGCWLLVDVSGRMWRQKVFSSGTGTIQDDQKLQWVLFSENDCRVERPYDDGPFDIRWRVAVVGGA